MEKKIIIMKEDIKNFILLNIIGDDDYIAIKNNSKLISKKIQKKDNKNDQLVIDLFKFINENNFELNRDISILVNIGPGSFSSIRISLSVARGISIVKGSRVFGYKKQDLEVFTPKNVDRLIKKKLFENKLIKPVYLS
ncbi:MAG: hypothetical protein CBD34_01880 [Rickettsiales bacterium TMED174]|nr:MAG: hypothetical protein CBD34_01880 [Rickettsiales bacterium TMED174]